MAKERNDDELVKKLQEAVRFFETTELPSAIQLSNHEVIADVKKFANTHLKYLRNYWKNESLRSPYLIRFLKAYDLISTNTYEQPDLRLLGKRNTEEAQFGTQFAKKKTVTKRK